MTLQWSPVKRIRRAEKNHLRRLCRSGQVHGRGINSHKKPRLAY